MDKDYVKKGDIGGENYTQEKEDLAFSNITYILTIIIVIFPEGDEKGVAASL